MNRARSRVAVGLVACGAMLALGGTAAASPSGEIFLYGTAGAADTGAVAASQTSPSIAGVSPGNGYEVAYHGTDDVLHILGTTVNGSLNLGLRASTSPSIIGLSGHGYEVALQFANSDFAVTGTAGTAITTYGMNPSTDPDIGHVAGGGWIGAFAANTNLPYTVLTTSAGGGQHPTGTTYGSTHPAVVSTSGGYTTVYQGANADLWTTTSASSDIDDHLGMRPGTSPDVAPNLATGGYEIAFQANTGALYLDTGASHGSTGVLLAPDANPSITNLAGGGFEVAYRGADGRLGLYGSAAVADTGIAIAPGTDPTIGGLPQGGYEVAYAAPEIDPAPAPAPAPGPIPITGGHTVDSSIHAAHRHTRRRQLRSGVDILWRWQGARTLVRRVSFTRLPRRGTVAFTCIGHTCPEPRARSASVRRIASLRKGLVGLLLRSGDRLRVTIASRGYEPVRGEFVIRRGRRPLARSLPRRRRRHPAKHR